MAKQTQDILSDLQLIKLKLIILLRQNAHLNDKLQEAENEVKQLRSELELQKNQLRQVAEQNKIAKLADALNNDERDMQELKKKLNAYIRDIDACIRLLSES
jgi:predicted RNase H-like nuclease (RuvC/YqgF family)